MPIRLYKDSLAFRLLRMHGYRVSPRKESINQSSSHAYYTLSLFVPFVFFNDFFNHLYVCGLLSTGRFCWFLQHADITSFIEENYNSLLSTLLNVYRATEVTFLGENELEEARSFSRTLLERGITMKTAKDSVVTFNIQREVIYHMIQDHVIDHHKQT